MENERLNQEDLFNVLPRLANLFPIKSHEVGKWVVMLNGNVIPMNKSSIGYRSSRGAVTSITNKLSWMFITTYWDREAPRQYASPSSIPWTIQKQIAKEGIEKLKELGVLQIVQIKNNSKLTLSETN